MRSDTGSSAVSAPATTSALLEDFGVWLGFTALVSVAETATGCSALTLGTGFGTAAFGLAAGFGVGLAFIALVSEATVAAGCSALALGSGYLVVLVGFFIAI